MPSLWGVRARQGPIPAWAPREPVGFDALPLGRSSATGQAKAASWLTAKFRCPSSGAFERDAAHDCAAHDCAALFRSPSSGAFERDE